MFSVIYQVKWYKKYQTWMVIFLLRHDWIQNQFLLHAEEHWNIGRIAR